LLAQIARAPDRVDLVIEKARLLIELDRLDDAKDVYLGILTKEPTHFVALNNFGTLLRMMGFHSAALKVQQQVILLMPQNVRARLSLANTLRECGELPQARAHYEIALRDEPESAEAHQGLAYVLAYLGEKEAAHAHWRRSHGQAAAPVARMVGNSAGPRLLVFSSPCSGNSPITRLLQRTVFQTAFIVPNFHDPAQPLPEHDLVINAVGDADKCASALEVLPALLGRTSRPVLNVPERILTTGREDNALLLGQLEDVTTARMERLPCARLLEPSAPAQLQERGFTFPLLLRSPGYHEGSYFRRVETPAELAAVAGGLPGRELLVIEYLDARDDDGKIRKFRVMMIGGRLYPLHKAVSREWMIHYHSADMANSAEHRAEDAAYLNDMPAVLGPRAIRALERVVAALGLDYAGADFSLRRDGGVILYEANATMCAPTPERGEKWAFRAPAVQRIHEAVREMIFARARGAETGHRPDA
jgi:hypothetical protein